jgi:hypothetical protein
MGPERRVYCRFCEQDFLSAEDATCPLCRKVGGLVDPIESETVIDLIARKRDDWRPPINWCAGFQRLPFVIGGAVCGVIGVIFLYWELLEPHPSFSGVLWSIAIIMCSLALVGVLTWFSIRPR